MSKKNLTFKHSLFQLYCDPTYQFVSKNCFIKSNTMTLNYTFFIAFIQIKIKAKIFKFDISNITQLITETLLTP
jgi:hypothetical protein